MHSGGGHYSPRCPCTCVAKASLKRKQEPNKVRKHGRCLNLFAENRWTPKIRVRSRFSGFDAPPRDVVLLAKPFRASEDLAQVPKVCFPFVGLSYLVDFPTSANPPPPTASVSQRESREFLRTAQLVEQSPWKLHRTAEYLQTPVSHDADGSSHTWKVLAIRWIFEEARAGGCPLER